MTELALELRSGLHHDEATRRAAILGVGQKRALQSFEAGPTNARRIEGDQRNETTPVLDQRHTRIAAANSKRNFLQTRSDAPLDRSDRVSRCPAIRPVDQRDDGVGGGSQPWARGLPGDRDTRLVRIPAAKALKGYSEIAPESGTSCRGDVRANGWACLVAAVS